VALGRKYVSSSLAEKLASRLELVPNGHSPRLSDRECEVMSMIASGKRLTEIATELYLSVKTVGTYRSRILKKMNMKNNAELVRYSLEKTVHGLTHLCLCTGSMQFAILVSILSDLRRALPALQPARFSRSTPPSEHRYHCVIDLYPYQQLT